MNWTPEKLQAIPEVYRDFMRVLKPVIDSRKPGVVLRFEAIPFGQLYGALAELHGYSMQQVRAVADTLCQQGLVEEDQHGFFVPTGPGEELILALSGANAYFESHIPPFPTFEESR